MNKKLHVKKRISKHQSVFSDVTPAMSTIDNFEL